MLKIKTHEFYFFFVHEAIWQGFPIAKTGGITNAKLMNGHLEPGTLITRACVRCYIYSVSLKTLVLMECNMGSNQVKNVSMLK